MRGGTVVVCVCLGVLACAHAAGAHALLRRSVPASGVMLQRAPAVVTLVFTEAPEPSLAIVQVLDSAGRRVDRGRVEPVPGHPLELRVPLGRLPNGVYTVTWRTVSRVDGHTTGGSFAFGVGVAPGSTAPRTTANPFPSALSILSRWAMYLGLSGLLGAAWVWTAALGQPPARWLYAWTLWGAAVAGVATLGVSQAADAGASIGRLVATPLGAALGWRLFPLAVAGAALATGGRMRARRRRIALAAVGLLAAASMLADVLASHAAANPGPWRWPNIADQWVHFLSVGVWLGGLGALLVALGATPTGAKAVAVRRFSAVAGVALGTTALTGVLRAVDEVGRWSALLTTDFGRLVLVKAGCLLALAALGAVNRYRSIPRVLETLRGLRRVGAAELTVAVVVLGVTGVLTGLAPPSLVRQAAPAASAIVVNGHDFATSVRVRLEITPGYPGENRFVARIVDYDTGRPVKADAVTLRFRQPERPEVGESTAALKRAPDGTYRGRGTNLSLDGTWSIVTLVERGLQSTEVPFTVTARALPEVVHTITAPGQPTLYNIDLPAGRILELYLDPGKPGFDEVHTTFITAAGGELQVPRLAVITVARPGQAPRALPVRRFSAGHFIADARLGPGDWRIDVTATARDGSVLHAHLSVHL